MDEGPMTPMDTMRAYFAAWNAGDFDALEALFAPDATLDGPLGVRNGRHECRAGLAHAASLTSERRVLTMVPTHDGVLTWFAFHGPTIDPINAANWAQIDESGIRRVRVAFDPRRLLQSDVTP